MLVFFSKVMVASLLISTASWLSSKKPELAGFLISLPLTSIIALIFSYGEFQDQEKSIIFAKSIFVGVPVSLLFFAPFLVANKFDFGFLTCLTLGIALLVAGYFLHRSIMGIAIH